MRELLAGIGRRWQNHGNDRRKAVRHRLIDDAPQAGLSSCGDAVVFGVEVPVETALAATPRCEGEGITGGSQQNQRVAGKTGQEIDARVASDSSPGRRPRKRTTQALEKQAYTRAAVPASRQPQGIETSAVILNSVYF